MRKGPLQSLRITAFRNAKRNQKNYGELTRKYHPDKDQGNK